MSGSSCCLLLQQIQTLQSQPWLLVDFFALCSKFLSAESVARYQLVQGETETAKSQPKNAHDTALCAAEMCWRRGSDAVPMSLCEMPDLLTTPFSAWKPVPGVSPEGINQAEMLMHYKCALLKQSGIAAWALGCVPKALLHKACTKTQPSFNLLSGYRGQPARRHPLTGAESLLQSAKMISAGMRVQ